MTSCEVDSCFPASWLYFSFNCSASCLIRRMTWNGNNLDACDVTLSVYPHRASLKNMPDHGGNRTYDLWNTSPMLCQLNYAVRSVRVCDISEQNLVPSISMYLVIMIFSVLECTPTMARHIFQACLVWIYSNMITSQASYSPEYITPTQKKSRTILLFIHNG